MSLPFQDLVGIPTFYVDTVVPEDAGNGNVRVWNCTTRGGILTPQFEVIIHSTKLLIACSAVRMAAEHAINTDMMMIGALFH